MGKYGGLSGQYYYKTKKAAEDNLKVAKERAAKGTQKFNMRVTGSRGFWTLTITKRKARK